MSRTKEVVVNERRELALVAELELGEAEGDDILLSTDEGKPVVGLVLSVVGVVLMVLPVLLPS